MNRTLSLSAHRALVMKLTSAAAAAAEIEQAKIAAENRVERMQHAAALVEDVPHMNRKERRRAAAISRKRPR